MLASLSKLIDKTLELIKSFLRTDVGAAIFVFGGSIGIIALFFGNDIVKLITGESEDDTKERTDFFGVIVEKIMGTEIPPFTPPPILDEAGDFLREGSKNFTDAVIGFFTGLFGQIQSLLPTGEGQQPPA